MIYNNNFAMSPLHVCHMISTVRRNKSPSTKIPMFRQHTFTFDINVCRS